MMDGFYGSKATVSGCGTQEIALNNSTFGSLFIKTLIMHRSSFFVVTYHVQLTVSLYYLILIRILFCNYDYTSYQKYGLRSLPTVR